MREATHDELYVTRSAAAASQTRKNHENREQIHNS